MKLRGWILILFTVIALLGAGCAQTLNTSPTNTITKQTSGTNSLIIVPIQTCCTNEYRVQKLEDQIIEVRRDELNYQIEKNILKEVYSSNLQNLNLFLTIGLGLFTILGFFGFKDIAAIKKDYSQELEKLRNITIVFEQQAKALKEKQDAIDKENQQRDRKIRLLQIRQIGKQLKDAKKYPEALAQIENAIQMGDDSRDLRVEKSTCLAKLGRFRESFQVLNEMIQKKPDDIFAVGSLLEFSLFLKDFGYFEVLLKKYSFDVQREYGSEIIYYLEALKMLQSDQQENLKAFVANRLHILGEVNNPLCPNWTFDEIRCFIGAIKSPVVEAFLRYVDLLDKAKFHKKEN